MDLSYCVVNTNGRELLLACLASIRDHGPDGARERDPGRRQRLRRRLGRRRRALERVRRGARRAPAADPRRAARGQGGARQPAARRGARRALPAPQRGLRAAPRRGRGAGRARCGPTRRPARPERCCSTPPAGRSRAPGGCPGLGTSIASALFLHRWLVVESGGERTREVGWVQSAAMLVRARGRAARSATSTPSFFVYSDETDFCQAPARRRLADPPRPRGRGRPPRAAGDRPRRARAADRRVSPRPRPLPAQAPRRGRPRGSAGVLAAWSYAVRALVALVLPGHEPALYRLHARQALRPDRGEGCARRPRPTTRARSRRS